MLRGNFIGKQLLVNCGVFLSEELKQKVMVPNRTTFQILISAAGICQDIEAIASFWQTMRAVGINPNRYTMHVMTKAYAINKQHKAVMILLNAMNLKYQIEPSPYTILVALEAFTSDTRQLALPLIKTSISSFPKETLKVLLRLYTTQPDSNPQMKTPHLETLKQELVKGKEPQSRSEDEDPAKILSELIERLQKENGDKGCEEISSLQGLYSQLIQRNGSM